MVCKRFARSVSLRRDSVKQEASVNAAPNPKIVCADFVGSTVTSAAGAFFAGLVQAISGPAARRLPLLSVTSVCAGLAGGCAASGSMFAFAATPNAEAAAAPTPRPAYFRISRRVVTLDSPLSLIHTHGLDPGQFARGTGYCKIDILRRKCTRRAYYRSACWRGLARLLLQA